MSLRRTHGRGSSKNYEPPKPPERVTPAMVGRVLLQTLGVFLAYLAFIVITVLMNRH